MAYLLTWQKPAGPAFFELPLSKSESARLLVMQALQPGLRVQRHSTARDTQVLQGIMRQAIAGQPTLDAHDAGTALRFGLAWLAVSGYRGLLTGTARMQQRPIGILVEALRQLGARIAYVGQPGYPPLRLDGFNWSGFKELELDASISSQYISALMLVAPALPAGLHIKFRSEPASAPYIALTAELMRKAGAQVDLQPLAVTISPQPYQPVQLEVGADWSAASYPLAASLLTRQPVQLPGLNLTSAQGDKVITGLLAPLGLDLMPFDGGLMAHCQGPVPGLTDWQIDFTHCPDLAQTVVALAAGLNQPVHATGLQSLYIKETDRVQALVTELTKLGARLHSPAHGELVVEQRMAPGNDPVAINTWGDHRMAMALAPLACIRPLIIDEPAVTAKSFPEFWLEMEKLGYQLRPVQA